MTRKKRNKDERDRLFGLLTVARDRQDEPGTCPSPETLALFIDGRLTGLERESVVRHLASCQSCYDLWLSGAAEPQQVAKPGKEGSSRKRVFGYLGTALAAAASVALYLNLQDVRQDEITNQADTFILQKSAPVETEPHAALKSAMKSIAPAPATPAPQEAQEAQVDKEESLFPQFEQSARMQGEAAPASKIAGAANLVKTKSMSATREKDGRAADALPPEFTEAVRTACGVESASPATWQRLYEKGTGYLQTQNGGDSPEKLARIVRIIKTMIDSGDTAEGCRQLQGELAEEDESR